MARRKAGEGTWGKKKIGKYTYHYYRDTEQNYTYGKTIKEVKEKIKEKESKQVKITDRTTFGEFLKWYIDTILSTKVESTTLLTYTRTYNSIIEFKNPNNICNMQLCSFTPEIPHIQNFLNALATKYSRNTINNMWTLIGSAIRYGIRNERLPHTLLDNIVMPKESQVASKKKEIPFLPLDAVEKLYKELEAVYPNSGEEKYGIYGRVIILFINTGLRLGEMRALRWNDIIELKNGKAIRIDESYAEIKYRSEDKKSIIKSPKNESSKRTVPLNNKAIEMLDWIEQLHPNHKSNDFVCKTKSNKIVGQQYLHYTLQRMLKAIDFPLEPKVSIHALRHTFGSLLYDQGVDLKTISLLLGHSSIKTTESIYVDVTKQKLQNAVDVLNILNKTNDTNESEDDMSRKE